MTYDLMLSCRWILTADDHQRVWQNHALLIKDGIIQAIKPIDSIPKKAYIHRVDYPHHIVTPGLINAHAHSPMVLFRGIGNDLPLQSWLQDKMWPLERRHMSDEMVYEGTYLAIAEMLLSGTTCFNEHYFLPDAARSAVLKTGIRAAMGLWLGDVENIYGHGIAPCFQAAERYLTDHEQTDQLKTVLAPHSPYLLDDMALKRLHALAEQHQLQVCMHLCETSTEVQDALQRYHCRPVHRLDQFGLLNDRFVAIHAIHLNEEDIHTLSAKHVHVVTCPLSNMKLASGGCLVDTLMDKGINVALGTDGAASNNRVDLFAEMRIATLQAKHIAQDPTALSAAQALQMATIHGAKALGWQDAIGSIEVGKCCDIVAHDMSDFRLQPIDDPFAALVYAGSSRWVQDVWVGGNRLVHDGKCVHMDHDYLSAVATKWAARMI